MEGVPRTMTRESLLFFLSIFLYDVKTSWIRRGISKPFDCSFSYYRISSSCFEMIDRTQARDGH